MLLEKENLDTKGQDENLSHLENLENLSHLKNLAAARTLVADVQAKIRQLQRLQIKMIAAEEEYKRAREQYEHYKQNVVVAAMANAGIEQLQDDMGNFVRLESKYHCRPNKNDEDRLIIQKWLEDMELDHIFKHEGKVDASQYDRLKEHGIPYVDKIDVNTNSLKAAILDLLGYRKGSMAKIALTDIPDCIHFTVQQDVVIE